MRGIFESLENRTLFAAGIYEPLVVDGTDGADTILVETQGDFVKLTKNGVTTTHRWKSVFVPGSTPNSGYFAKGISKIVLSGKGGADLLDASKSPVKMEIYGGDGRDTIKGGAFDDMLMGPEKRPANGSTNHPSEFVGDVISGGAGKDNLIAAKEGVGASLHGDAGNDTIWGSEKSDVITLLYDRGDSANAE